MACRLVANRVVLPTTVTNAIVGWPRRIVRLHMRRATRLTPTSPITWTSTVTTINGSPHAQSAGDAQDSNIKPPTDWAIPIEHILQSSIYLARSARLDQIPFNDDMS